MSTVLLPAAIEARLGALATALTAATARTKTSLVLEAFAEHLDDLEDVQLAQQCLLDIRSGKSQTIPLHDVMKQYGMVV